MQPREQCDWIWQFRLAHSGARPKRNSNDAEERRYRAWVTEEALDNRHRRRATLSRLRRIAADVVMLQEVDYTFFEEALMPFFEVRFFFCRVPG